MMRLTLPPWQERHWRFSLETAQAIPGERLLDVGCGSGDFCRLAAASLGPDGHAVGLEPRRDAFGRAAQSPGTARLALVRGRGETLPFPDACFDLVVSLETVEYLCDPAILVKEAYRVLRPGGRLLLAHRDYDTLTVTVRDRALARRLIAALADSGPDGWAGRKLWGYLAAAPWSSREAQAYTPVLTLILTHILSGRGLGA